ncbi:hypothetical protein COV16_03420 [Candidatus Woesearchaeota archaeon CG10_big_fil_rev_8_21_14_0_10_34_8]|nr:MAG: hypothetical protein COV16_03420 [Candidatus Woesearchaeota archaeon CG10_big_fil_rev_8_21_14_0_10_34_8]
MNLTIFSDRNNLNELSNSLTNNNKADYQKIKKFHKVSRGLEREILSFIQKRNKKHSVWGWKDPRTVLTYKIWKQYLPEANIVILFRHPLRVADSLIRRATDPIIKNVPLSSLKSWILYNSILVDIIHNTKKEKIIVIEDKELIKQPRDFVSLLSEHCNQEISYKEITNIFDPHLMSTKINRTTKLLTLKHPFFTAKSLHLYHQLQKNSTVPIKTSSKRNFPNFLVIGTGKAGTSSIYEYLKQHPQVYMSPVKETNFFAFFDADTTTYAKEDQDWISKSITHLEEYSTQFNSIKNEKAIGEVSPIYLFHPKAAEQIKNILPKVKIIVILRNPIDRAFSGYSMHVRRGTEKRSFAKATQGNAHNASYIRGFYLEKGLYYRQLKRYYSLFPEKQIKIFLFEDLCDNPLKFMEEMYQFLEVDPMFTPNVTKWYNAAPMKTKIPSSHRKRLVEYFRTDIKQLERLTNKDLSDWLR